jgi:AraC family transcriptional regulator
LKIALMKESTHNEYHKSINTIIDYINDNLNESIDLKTLALISNTSEFHFHRLFKAFIGEPIGSYVTRQRIERAAQILRTSNCTLTEIAERVGYQSSYSLSKAFKKHFGISPSAFRNLETFFTSKPTSSKFTPLNLSPEIIKISKKELVYTRIISQYGSKKEYTNAWKELVQFGKSNNILNSQTEYIGLSFDDPSITKSDKCRFYACITTPKTIKPIGQFSLQTLKEGKYAVFSLSGNYSELEKLYNSIYFDWLPKSEFQLRNDLPFEKYLNNPDKVREQDILTEVFIPIISK